ncbi:unnamed protein product [Ectocarpus sp. CCAP 1310/34]|nr:unnamed protein product [Ectocarpus sp. CCAP 1310/34]
MMHSTTGYDHLVKLLIIGDSGVGKSCLLLRYSDDQFSGSYISTIGIDFKIKTVFLMGKKAKLQIWDTAGQERFRNITSAYYRGSMGIMLVYDVTDLKSFKNVGNWMRQIELNAAPDVNVTLVGNKSDVAEEERVVSLEQGQRLAAEHGDHVRFFETSARSNVNVTEAFEGLATDVITRLQAQDEASLARVAPLKLGQEEPTKKSDCC